jgi:hypothetical protein
MGTGDGAFADAAPIAVGDLCPLFTRDLCIYLMQCDQAPYRNLAHCEAELDCFGLPQLQMAAASGAVLYDPAQVGACNARFLADPCGFGFFLFTPDIFEVLAYCPGTITPQLKAGDPCVSSGECSQGLYCKKPSGCPGTCTPFSQAGESCTGPALCDPKLDCTTVPAAADASTGSTDVCEPPPRAGDPCLNGSCGSTENCPSDPGLCAGVVNVWCDPASNTCKAAAGEGAACGTPADAGTTGGSVACASDLWCDQVFLGQPGTCRKASGQGGPCSDVGCGAGLHCAGYVPFGASATLGMCRPVARRRPLQRAERLPGGHILRKRHVRRGKAVRRRVPAGYRLPAGAHVLVERVRARGVSRRPLRRSDERVRAEPLPQRDLRGPRQGRATVHREHGLRDGHLLPADVRGHVGVPGTLKARSPARPRRYCLVALPMSTFTAAPTFASCDASVRITPSSRL